MAYDSTLAFRSDAGPADVLVDAKPFQARTDDDFHRGERMVVITGAAALGAMLGIFAAIGLGRLESWMIFAAGAPVYALGLYFTAATFHDARACRAMGCATASGLHMLALLAWPAAAFFYPMSAAPFWIAPAIALSALALFASCWGGTKRAVYRACGQGVLVTASVVYVGFLTIMGA